MREFLVYSLYRLGAALSRHLSPRVAFWAAGWMGAVLYALSPRTRHSVFDNMQHVLGPAASPAQVRACARRVCGNLIKGYYELFRVDRLSADDIRKRLHIDGEEHGLQAIARGRGVIFVAPHFGNVDITAQIPRLYGLTVTVVAEHIRPERVYRYVLGLRASHGMRFLPSDGPMLGLFRALKRGEAIGLACDRTVTENGREMMFFGAPARLPDGAIVLARRTGAVVLPARALRLPDDTFHIQVEPPIEIERTEDPEADVIAGMECLVRIMERWIGAHPDQWLLTVPIWQQAEAR